MLFRLALHRPELQQRDLVGNIFVDRLDRHADLDVLDIALKQIGRQARAFLELDLHDGIGHARFKPLRPCLYLRGLLLSPR